MSVEIKEIRREYMIEDGKFRIFAKKEIVALYNPETNPHTTIQNKLTISNKFGGDEFKFIDSKPEVVRKIGELLIEASRLG